MPRRKKSVGPCFRRLLVLGARGGGRFPYVERKEGRHARVTKPHRTALTTDVGVVSAGPVPIDDLSGPNGFTSPLSLNRLRGLERVPNGVYPEKDADAEGNQGNG